MSSPERPAATPSGIPSLAAHTIRRLWIKRHDENLRPILVSAVKDAQRYRHFFGPWLTRKQQRKAGRA